MSKRLSTLLASLLFAAASPAIAADSKMDDRTAYCAKEAKALKGEERETFVEKCLKKSPAQIAQQQKMKGCHADAAKKDLHGDSRREFMSTCLKG